MTLFRFVILLVIAWLLLKLLRTVFAPPRVRRPGPGMPPPPPGGPERAGPPERLVLDPVCGVRIPEGRAVREGSRFFCSEECRRRFHAGAAGPPPPPPA